VLHGGPGAPESVAALARELGADRGVLEPLQTARTVGGQVEELVASLDRNAESPVALVGWSWGAFLGFLTAARHPDRVSKLVLVSSGPFEARYAAGIAEARLSRLGPADRERTERWLRELRAGRPLSAEELAAFGRVFERADAFDPIETEPAGEFDAELFRSVWTEAEEMRASGALLAEAARIECPAIAIHGDYDPHPAEGVREPLRRTLRDFRFVLLPRCGHTPWLERGARDAFYRALRKALDDPA
jgi:pimeloyl-ACP methyl ester carboxylesterase